MSNANPRRSSVGRFSAELLVANNEDIVRAKAGLIPDSEVRRARIQGIVDTGSTRLVLPEAMVAALGLPDAGMVAVRFAGGRREERKVAGNVQVEILGRSS